MFLDKIKGKLHHNDDIEDIRDRILSEERNSDYDRRFEKRFEGMENKEALDPALRPFDPRDDISGMAFREAQQMQEVPGRRIVDIDEPAMKIGSYEVMDKLNFIESQLSAIKSQTELLNERMKNLETKLGYSRRW